MISNLQRFDNNGLELIIDTSTGEVFASIRAVARMTDKNPSSILRYVNGGLKTVAQMELISAEIPTATGLKTVALMNEKQMLELINYYKPSLLIKFAECGFRIFLHGLAGYRYEAVQKPIKPKTPLELAKEQVKLWEQIELQEQQIKMLEEENQELAEAVDELFEYSSIIRVAKYNNCSEKAFNWRKLKAASKVMGLEIKKVPCPRFGTKNLYSHDAWRYAYPDYNLPETTTLRLPEGDE